MNKAEDIHRRKQLRTLLQLARYRQVFHAVIINAGVFAGLYEGVGLSFYHHTIKFVHIFGNPAVKAAGLRVVFVLTTGFNVLERVGYPSSVFSRGACYHDNEPVKLISASYG